MRLAQGPNTGSDSIARYGPAAPPAAARARARSAAALPEALQFAPLAVSASPALTERL